MTLLALMLALAAAPPPTYRVDSVAALQARIDAARPGDVIVVKDGIYTITAPLAVHAIGRRGATVRIAAATVGGVTLTGTDGFDIAADAAWIEIDGFVFAHRSGRTQVRSGAAN